MEINLKERAIPMWDSTIGVMVLVCETDLLKRKVVDYDGKESVIYVVNGKLHRAPVDWWCLEL